jgi:hypothetical protein
MWEENLQISSKNLEPERLQNRGKTVEGKEGNKFHLVSKVISFNT